VQQAAALQAIFSWVPYCKFLLVPQHLLSAIAKYQLIQTSMAAGEAVFSPDPLSDPNLLGCVLRWLRPVDLVAASAVCRSWGAAVSEPGFWESIDAHELWKGLRSRASGRLLYCRMLVLYHLLHVTIPVMLHASYQQVMARCPQNLRAGLLHRTLVFLLGRYGQHVRRLMGGCWMKMPPSP
jgi:hypothetical protein